KGFGYAPGASVARSFQSLVDDKLLKLDAPIGAAMWDALKPVLLNERLQAWRAVFDATRQAMQASGAVAQVHTVSAATVADLAANNVVLDNAAVWMRDNELVHALRDTKTARGAALPDDVWRDLPLRLDVALPYLDTQDRSLMYFIDLGAKFGKVAVRVNYNEKGRFDGVRAKIISNFIQTGGLVDARSLNTGTQYVPLKK
ncbi:MAG: hypothetical protein PHQ13_04250, partial [Rhodoferax sp.]|nr:hypothetical protein [Rhodoferax sp.]